MPYYIVYSYKHNYEVYQPPKYIMGIYTNIENAINRQKKICNGLNTPSNKYTTVCNLCTTFINILPENDCMIELFSSYPDNKDDSEYGKDTP